MKHLIYFSSKAVTSGKAISDAIKDKNLMKVGRIDIVCHFVIQSLFLSNSYRTDTKVHLLFYGKPDPPKHLEIQMNEDLDLSKKDIANLIKKMLYKFKEGKKIEVFPKCFIEKKSLFNLINELVKQDNEIFILDKKGKDIRKEKILENSVFVIGDQNGIPKKEMRRLKKISKVISIGSKTYFASQTSIILGNELDRQNN